MSTRRDFLRAAGLIGARLSIGTSAAGCACDFGTEMRTAGCGAATFEVTPHGALISIHGGDRREAIVQLTGDAPVEQRVELLPESGHTSVLELSSLEPDHEYEYTVAVDGGEFGPYRLRTAPAPDSEAAFRFLFTGDIETGDGCAIFDTMAGAGADFWLSLGDFPYADRSSRTRGEYRRAHRAARLAGGAQTLLAALPAFAIYDDHEVRNNWDAALWRRDPDRVAAALSAWDEWFPLRTADEQRYRSWRWGSLAEFFMLDCRRFRADSSEPDGSGKSMLGAAQRDWLIDGLLASSALFKFVVTSVPLAFGTTGPDSWEGYRWERDRILAAVIEAPVPNTVFLAADQHWFASHHLAGGIIEFQAGPAATSLRRPGTAQPGEVFRHMGRNFAEVTVHGGSDPHLLVRAVGPRGQEHYREVVRVAGRT